MLPRLAWPLQDASISWLLSVRFVTGCDSLDALRWLYWGAASAMRQVAAPSVAYGSLLTPS